MKIAIIEDEYVIRKGISKILAKINREYEIVGEAEDGIEGLNLVKTSCPDLIITDIRMPKMDGLELLFALRHEGIDVKAIVLSAYSEFQYAQKAISLGVSEYILKPISISELSSALLRIENQLSHENKINAEHPKELYELDNILRGSILGTLKLSQDLNKFLQEQYNLYSTDEMGIFAIYLGELFPKKIDKLKAELKTLNKKEFEASVLEFSQDNMIIVIIYNIKNRELTKGYFVKNMVSAIKNNVSEEFVFGWNFSDGLLKINESVEVLKDRLQFNLTVEGGTVINYADIDIMKIRPFLYPIDIEDKIKAAIVKKDINQVKEVFLMFENYCRNEVYKPTDIKKACVSFCWAVVNTSKQLNSLLYQNLDIQISLKKIMMSITWKEIEQVFYKLFKEILEANIQEEDKTLSLSVKRAQSLIHEYYNQGINLDEIAMKLNITADYLGKQFKKEIGESFNTYARNYRINKVKTLLLGTELKVYQIAELTGYSDSKYMSKVFKEVTGYLPNDYRKLYK